MRAHSEIDDGRAFGLGGARRVSFAVPAAGAVAGRASAAPPAALMLATSTSRPLATCAALTSSNIRVCSSLAS